MCILVAVIFFGNLIDGAGDDVELGFLGERGAAFEEEFGEIEAFFAVDLIFFLSQNQGAVGEIEDKRLGEALW